MSSSKQSRDRGRLFGNADKRKPSQPDMRGECSIGGAAYDLSAWHRDEQLTIALAPARVGTKNTIPPDAFRGALLPAPKSTKRGAAEGDEKPVWIGEIAGDEQSYLVEAFQSQGKSGPYLTLYFADAEPSAD